LAAEEESLRPELSLLLEYDVHGAVITQSQQVARVSFINPDLEQAEAVEQKKAIALVGLVIAGVDASHFFAAEAHGIYFSFAQQFECILFDVGDQVSECIDADDVSEDLFFRGLHMAVRHLLE
jgi:hypothetical protein